jgi:hypothetical protein
VFFKVASLDQRQNQSSFYWAVKIVKPDNAPPSMPEITKTVATVDGILLKWVICRSPDVRSHHINRINIPRGDSKQITETSIKKGGSITIYNDMECLDSQIIKYKIEVIDKNKNHLEPAVSIDIENADTKSNLEIKKLQKQMALAKEKFC